MCCCSSAPDRYALDPVESEEEPAAAATATAPAAATLAAGAAAAGLWWSKLFVRAGRMGSMRQELKLGSKAGAGGTGSGAAAAAAAGCKEIRIDGFREQDQEALDEQVRGGSCLGGAS